jgi:hypothetical protein
LPFYLKWRDVSADIGEVHSALIVPCRFCPAVSIAVRENRYYLEPFSKLLKTAAYESHIKELKSSLENNGIRTAVFRNTLLHHFLMCMWPSGRRKDFAKSAAQYEAIIVLGCDAAVDTARDCLSSNNYRIMQGMEVEGVISVIPSLHFPFRLSLGMGMVTRVLEYPPGDIKR